MFGELLNPNPDSNPNWRLELGELLNPEGIATHTILAGKRAQEVRPPPRQPPGSHFASAALSVHLQGEVEAEDLIDTHQMDAVPVPMPMMNAPALARALMSSKGGAGITCRGQGTNASLGLPPMAPWFVKFIDGHRSVGDVFRMARAEGPASTTPHRRRDPHPAPLAQGSIWTRPRSTPSSQRCFASSTPATTST